MHTYWSKVSKLAVGSVLRIPVKAVNKVRLLPLFRLLFAFQFEALCAAGSSVQGRVRTRPGHSTTATRTAAGMRIYPALQPNAAAVQRDEMNRSRPQQLSCPRSSCAISSSWLCGRRKQRRRVAGWLADLDGSGIEEAARLHPDERGHPRVVDPDPSRRRKCLEEHKGQSGQAPWYM